MFMVNVDLRNVQIMRTVMNTLQKIICFIYHLKILFVKVCLTFHQTIDNSYLNDFLLSTLFSDYVTEKFFIPMNYDILPVVLGGANYSEIAPTKSYINTKDFSSPEELAGHLKYLVENQVAYHEYFEWKSYFNVYNTNEDFMAKSMCHLCEKLNSETSQEKIYEDINDFWRKQDCGG